MLTPNTPVTWTDIHGRARKGIIADCADEPFIDVPGFIPVWEAQEDGREVLVWVARDTPMEAVE